MLTLQNILEGYATKMMKIILLAIYFVASMAISVFHLGMWVKFGYYGIGGLLINIQETSEFVVFVSFIVVICLMFFLTYIVFLAYEFLSHHHKAKIADKKEVFVIIGVNIIYLNQMIKIEQINKKILFY